MDDKELILTLEINGNIVEIGKNQEFKLLNVEGLESSDFEITTAENATYDGSTKQSSRITERLITIGAEYPYINEETEYKRQEMIGIFSPKYTGKLTINYCGVERWINVDVRSFKGNRSNLYEPFSFLIILLAPNPYFKGDDFSENMASKTSLFTAPFSVPAGGVALSCRSFKQELQLYNDGHNETGLTITFISSRGEVTNPQLENITTGEYVKVNTAMAIGDVLTVNTNRGSTRIELNGVNISNKKDRTSRYFNMKIGENALKYTADNGYANLDVYVKWSKEYLGV